MTWWQALIDAGAVPVAFVPNPAAARGSKEETEPADGAALVEGAELEAHPVPDRGGARIPPAVSFLAGFARWGVVACDGIIQVAEQCIATLGADEWLVLDGLLSRSPTVARHPRALGIINSHGTPFLEGRGLERALTLPAGHRT